MTKPIPSLFFAAAAALAVAGCTTPFKAEVSRFQRLAPATGQSFVIAASDPALEGGIEFEQYAGLVTRQLVEEGYRPVATREAADLIVKLRYAVDKGQQRIVNDATPFYRGYAPFGYGYPYGRYRGRFIHGFYDPFLYGGTGFGGYGGVSSYTVYTSELEVAIEQKGDQRRLFEGKAEAQSRSNRLTYLVPNLVEAMFTDFPGNSGETVRISVAPEKK